MNPTQNSSGPALAPGMVSIPGVGIVPQGFSNVITPDKLTSANPVQLPPVANSSTPTVKAPIIGAPQGTVIDSASGNATIPPPPAPVAQPKPSATDWIKEQLKLATDTLSTKADVTSQLQNDTQLQQKREAATASYNAYNGAKLALQQRIENIYKKSGGTTGGAQDEAAAVAREGNADLANRALLSQVDAGNYADAQATIKDKLAAQFQPVQDRIDYLFKYADFNNNDPEARAAAKQLETDKANVQGAAEDLHKAVLQNAPADVQSSIYSAMDKVSNDFASGKITASEAQTKMFQAVGPYGANASDKLLKQAQLDNIRSEIEARGAKGTGTGGITDPTEVLSYAQQYASNGQIPPGMPKGSFGLVAQVAKELPQQPGTIVDANTGVKSSKFTSAQADAAAIMKDLGDRADRLKETYNNVGLLSTNADRQNYTDQRNEMVDLLARLRSGAAISQSELDAYEKKLPKLFGITNLTGANIPSVGNQKIDDFKSSVTGKLDTSLRTNGQVMYGFTTVKLGGNTYKVGDVIKVGDKSGRVLPDGTIAPI